MTTMTFASACGLAFMVTLGAATWLASFIKRDVSIVDSVWSLLIFGETDFLQFTPISHGSISPRQNHLVADG